jgi:hypothetical protein
MVKFSVKEEPIPVSPPDAYDRKGMKREVAPWNRRVHSRHLVASFFLPSVVYFFYLRLTNASTEQQSEPAAPQATPCSAAARA